MLRGGSAADPLPGQVAQPALDQVAGDGGPDGLGDHEAHPRARRRGPCGRARSTAPAGGPPSGDRRGDGHGARPRGSEQVRSGGCWRRARPAAHASGGEAVAALATTGGQDRATGAGAHAQAETVGLVPTTVVRLERALAQRIHSTQGACVTTVRSPGRVVRDDRQLQVNWHRSPMNDRSDGLSWTCGTGRRRFRPANGTRCARTGSIRPAGRRSPANRGTDSPAWSRFPPTRRSLGISGPIPVDNG